ncbi:MAG: hypothetical protein QOJ91_1612 [Sphingomonadales bacterium]|jgi:hypothetical protein|nr:hypothetical protein [Sphingomonadales bacterium]
MATPSISADICSRMVETAGRSCQPAIAVAAPPANPNWDAMAASFASLSNAFAWGSIVLAVVAIIAALAWGKIVSVTAEREARDMAKRIAEDYITNWMAQNAPAIIQRHVEFMQDATVGEGSDAAAADAIGQEA